MYTISRRHNSISIPQRYHCFRAIAGNPQILNVFILTKIPHMNDSFRASCDYQFVFSARVQSIYIFWMILECPDYEPNVCVPCVHQSITRHWYNISPSPNHCHKLNIITVTLSSYIDNRQAPPVLPKDSTLSWVVTEYVLWFDGTCSIPCCLLSPSIGLITHSHLRFQHRPSNFQSLALRLRTHTHVPPLQVEQPCWRTHSRHH